jgi:hypothetical protein
MLEPMDAQWTHIPAEVPAWPLKLAAEARLPIRLHGLRHGAATLALAARGRSLRDAQCPRRASRRSSAQTAAAAQTAPTLMARFRG